MSTKCLMHRGGAILAGLALWLTPLVASAQFGRDSVSTRVIELAGRDAPGATLVDPVETGRLAQGQVVTRIYGLQPDRCYWFIAVGDGNIHDLDLFVRRRGVEIVRDQSSSRETVVPGGRPYCPDNVQRVQVRLLAFRGGGVYATGVYSRAEAVPADAGAGEQNVTVLLERAAARYAPGMTRNEEPVTSRLAEGENLDRELRLEGGMCYRFVAVGGPGVEDLSMTLHQGSSEVARDVADTSEAVASYCATVETPLRLRIGMAEGAGEVAWALFSGGRQHGVRTPGREATPATPIGGDGEDFLARQLRSRHGRDGQGRHGASDVMRATLRTSQDRNFPVRLEAGRCYSFIAVGTPSVRDLDLYLLDPSGMEIASETGPENHAVLETTPCPRWSGNYTLRVRVFSGYGQVAVQAFGN